MSQVGYKVEQINSDTLQKVDYIEDRDAKLLDSFTLGEVFNTSKHFVEINFLDTGDLLLLSKNDYNKYKVLQEGESAGRGGAVQLVINPEEDLKYYGFEKKEVKILYNFLNNLYSSNNIEREIFYIESISPDRTELKLKTLKKEKKEVVDITQNLIENLEKNTYYPQFNLYLGKNIFYTGLNIDIEETENSYTILVKSYEPLSNTIEVKDPIDLVEKISNSAAFSITPKILPRKEDIKFLRGADFNTTISEDQSIDPSSYYTYNNLFSYPVTNTNREVSSLFNKKGIEISIDYSEFSNFINFSSAGERLANFKYKMSLLESYQESLDLVESASATTLGISGSREYYQGLVTGTLNNFDHYERHLYYESGTTSWPKVDSTKPYTNEPSTGSVGTAWYDITSGSAVDYDAENTNILINSIPSYLREDTDNNSYLLFVDMIAQHFDNLWIYTKAVTDKYDNDNRINRGLSKDLVAETLKNFGVKLYSSNKSLEDLFRYFTSNTYDESTETINTLVSSSLGTGLLSQNDYQKEVYKRLYHNLPFLIKSKGTERGIRALIACFGIPSDILEVKLYGGNNINSSFLLGEERYVTGSYDKIRVDNTGSIVTGDTLSHYTSIIDPEYKYTQDLHTIEIGYSPADSIDSYIISQSAVLYPSFSIDDHIGNPGNITGSRYNSLDTYRNEVLESVSNSDLLDFVRYIKFFDNSLFRMIKDFLPARNSVNTGIIIKPHLLERSKAKSVSMSVSQPIYSSSIDMYTITGSDGGMFSSSVNYSTAYSESVQTPYGKVYKSHTSAGGAVSYQKSHEEAKFTGELSGSILGITDGGLNKMNVLKYPSTSSILYNVTFMSSSGDNVCSITPVYANFALYGGPSSWEIPASNLTTLTDLFETPYGDYNYYVDNVSSSATSHIFSGATLYGSASITASKTLQDASICSASTIINFFSCSIVENLSEDTTNIPSGSYALSKWFITGSNTDDHIEYTMNSVKVSDSNTSSYSFTGGGEYVLRIRDDMDRTSCYAEVTITVDTDCQLAANSNNIWSSASIGSSTDLRDWVDTGSYPASHVVFYSASNGGAYAEITESGSFSFDYVDLDEIDIKVAYRLNEDQCNMLLSTVVVYNPSYSIDLYTGTVQGACGMLGGTFTFWTDGDFTFNTIVNDNHVIYNNAARTGLPGSGYRSNGKSYAYYATDLGAGTWGSLELCAPTPP